MNAIALNSAIFNAARVVGPALGGLLIARFGTGTAFLLNGAASCRWWECSFACARRVGHTPGDP